MKKDRNSPCECGSGKKYKKCCLTLQPIQVNNLDLNIEAACDAALELLENGNLDAAEKETLRLQSLHPTYPTVNYVLGVCQIQRKDFDAATSSLETAVDGNPKFCEAYFNLSILYREKLLVHKSVACLKKVIEIDGPRGILGKQAQGEIDKLENIIQRSAGISADAYLRGSELFDDAQKYLGNGEYIKAISLFEQVVALNPNNVQSYGNMGLAHSALGNQKQALEYLEKALAIDPNYLPAKQNRKIIVELKEGERLSSDNMVSLNYYAEVSKGNL